MELLSFKEIPYQIKLNDGEVREALNDDFLNAVEAATLPEDNIIFSRKWESLGYYYGELNDVLTEVKEEIGALYTKERLTNLVKAAKENKQPEPKRYFKIDLDTFKQEEDWKKRLYYLNHFDTPDEGDYEILSYALNDSKVQIRRMAVSLLAMIEKEETLNYLKQALQDKSVTVRRTAGDAYSDLGLKSGLKDMCPLLDDKSPIVRWRAAMFVYEVGDDSSLPFLYQYREDSSYECKLQKELAISRIEEGERALGSVWKQMEKRNQ
ncbi:virulence factor [Nosocomiicoccus massiliensis]|uniref:virulence factor n=1 Tax=Nosocomiicoccus massiliensis TaxID=1232430 RepID=UPI000422E05A|nr:virulence factor [Nosocomiicoccus massiliensis]